MSLDDNRKVNACAIVDYVLTFLVDRDVSYDGIDRNELKSYLIRHIRDFDNLTTYTDDKRGIKAVYFSSCDGDYEIKNINHERIVYAPASWCVAMCSANINTDVLDVLNKQDEMISFTITTGTPKLKKEYIRGDKVICETYEKDKIIVQIYNFDRYYDLVERNNNEGKQITAEVPGFISDIVSGKQEPELTITFEARENGDGKYILLIEELDSNKTIKTTKEPLSNRALMYQTYYTYMVMMEYFPKDTTDSKTNSDGGEKK